jgi:hypothetical protein
MPDPKDPKDNKQWVVPPKRSGTPAVHADFGAHVTLTPELRKTLEALATQLQKSPARGRGGTGFTCDNVTLCDGVQTNCPDGVSMTPCEDALIHCDGNVTYGPTDCTELV